MGRPKTPPVKLTAEQKQKLAECDGNVSAQIRYLYDQRLSYSQIQHTLGLEKYQRVRNVIARYQDRQKTGDV